eukprot:2829542-Prymnesium_polylepis.1
MGGHVGSRGGQLGVRWGSDGGQMGVRWGRVEDGLARSVRARAYEDKSVCEGGAVSVGDGVNEGCE